MAIEKIPAAPREMTAVEFVKEHHRMCQSMDRCFSCCICHDEDSPRSCAVLMGLNPEQTVAIVEQWAAEHPEKPEKPEKRKTYAEDFFEKFPKAPHLKCRGEELNRPMACRTSEYCAESRFCADVDCIACWNEEMEDES